MCWRFVARVLLAFLLSAAPLRADSFVAPWTISAPATEIPAGAIASFSPLQPTIRAQSDPWRSYRAATPPANSYSQADSRAGRSSLEFSASRNPGFVFSNAASASHDAGDELDANSFDGKLHRILEHPVFLGIPQWIDWILDPSFTADFYDPFGQQFAYGNRARQPYRLGWWTYNDVVYIPNSKAHGTTGSMQITEMNSFVRYAQPVSQTSILAWTLWMNGKFWNGPPGVELPYDGNQIMSEFQWIYRSNPDWSMQAIVTPQFNFTPESMSKQAIFIDGRLVFTRRLSEEWQLVGGLGFWDRVENRLVPYAGAIWTPDSRWEFRLLFPKSRISYYTGQRWGADWWIYAAGEYDVEAYAVRQEATHTMEQAEFAETRWLLGTNALWKRTSLFVEGGLITTRRVRFAGTDPNFNLAPAGILRCGITY